MSTPVRIRERLLALAHNIIDTDSWDGLMERNNLQTLHSTLEHALRSVIVAQNILSIVSKLPPETIITIAEFVAEPRTRESVFELVKVTHVCQYWRSTLISHPRLWSSIFVKNDSKDFVAACLERSRQLPLTVCLDLIHGSYCEYPGCACIKRSSEALMNEENPCRYHTTIVPLLQARHVQRINKLDVNFTMVSSDQPELPEWNFHEALDDFRFFALPLPSLESLGFTVHHDFDLYEDGHMELPKNLFQLILSPSGKLRHVVLDGCYGGPIPLSKNLTSFEFTGDGSTQLDQHTFLPLLSASASIESLALSGCSFPDYSQLSGVTPVKLSKLKTLQLFNMDEMSGLPRLMEIPALKTLSSICISTWQSELINIYISDFRVCAETDDGFRLLFDSPASDLMGLDWLDITRNTDPTPAFVRFDGRGPGRTLDYHMDTSPLPLFIHAAVIEIGSSFIDSWYPTFWDDLQDVGPQLTTLRLEFVEGEKPLVTELVKRLVKARWEKGMPLTKLERMKYEEATGEDEAKAEELWGRFRVGLEIDKYLTGAQ